MKIVVTGTRNTPDAKRRLWDAVAPFAQRGRVILVHGDSGDVDAAARGLGTDLYNTEHEPHPADWDTHGKAAGPIRNEEMAKAGADLCIAIWDGKSRGTLDMIKRATQHGIPVRIVPVAT